MVGGGLRCLTCFFTCSAVLLFGVCLHDVEASGCQRAIHKKVGDTVEFSSCLPTEGVTLARWKYGASIIADKDRVFSENRFKGRLDLNPTNFSLTVRRLTLRDSGDFSFFSEVNDKQRDSVTFTLQVHEPITEQPVLTGNSTWNTLNKSCTVVLDCSATVNRNVSYNWTVRNQTISGSRLQYSVRAQDGDTKFTCTIYNFVSEKSASEIVTCSNKTQETVFGSSSIVPLILGLLFGIVLIILLLLSLLWYTKSKDPCFNRLTQSQTVNQDETQQHIYSSLQHGDGSVYETIRGSEHAGTDGPPNEYSNVTSPSVHLKDVGKQSDDCVYESMRGSEEAGNDLVPGPSREAQMT